MPAICLFCKQEIIGLNGGAPTPSAYLCKRCGPFRLTDEAVEELGSTKYSIDDLAAVSITCRLEWERAGRPDTPGKQTDSSALKQMIAQFRHMTPLEKMDRALVNLEKASALVGDRISVSAKDDFPLFYCKAPKEVMGILSLLSREELIHAPDPTNPHMNIAILAKGYQRLKEIQKPNRESGTCFVAMWFTPEMNEVYLEAIKPAVEFIEAGEQAPRYQAVKIDNFEHIHDINDEMIAQIRKSRFMICDLTGYRGGVYFEAGFAYGLGLDVIYTCRKDWTKEEILKDDAGRDIKTLYDGSGGKIAVKKEGVHFDLAHTARIEWEADKLEDFKNRLKNRIQAVIV